MTCTACHREERADEHHAVSSGLADYFGTPLPLTCYDDEGEEIPPADEDDAPTDEELSAVAPDPWTDPDAAAAAVPPPF